MTRGPRSVLLLAPVIAALLTLLSGCASSNSGSPSSERREGPVPTVEHLHLLLTSVALDTDGKPGPDGFGARLYASNRKATEAPAITRGRIELLMFDGALPAAELAAARPLTSWTFDAVELKNRVQKTSIGVSYRFALTWGKHIPAKPNITIQARYYPEKGEPVVSGPGTIPIRMP